MLYRDTNKYQKQSFKTYLYIKHRYIYIIHLKRKDGNVQENSMNELSYFTNHE